MPRIALYQPDIPHNTGAILRFAACVGVEVDIIEPAGFDLSDRGLKRAGMDYVERAALRRHISFAAFEDWRAGEGGRLVLLSTKAALPYTDFAFRPDDILLFGRESAGVPESVHERAEARLIVPMRPGLRSINLAMTVAMVTGEALRQTGGLPGAEIAAAQVC
ncbi:tRNA (cytidine(34)-2'-O)-methyltransferase [Kaistia sp. 32K]|uniref:tRNA (cytidine(34)-2'-O)-methyltransferase n=1 Tax=Kaistia sp. 32K TaxID=2795690 RepID=UPI001915E043|nr:tRNA (cytidine(34)-2'-O)-methyltransferase [Kaistia sp. 32K]BCP54666.1 tRNA (cytidine(34)-2'-O)-methyltransferase [Kaistia sp. 32K]